MTDESKPARLTFSHGRATVVVSRRKAIPTVGVVPRRKAIPTVGVVPKRRRPPDAGSCPVEPAPKPRPLTPVPELVGDE